MRHNFEEVKKDFEETKEKYEKLRETERNELSKYLVENIEKKIGLKVTRKGSAGKGKVNYNSGGRIEEYDLRNWKWVELEWKNDYSSFSCVVSLNMHEVDPNSANVHALYDRIGLYITYQIRKNCHSTAIYTDVNLPLCDDEYAYIAQLILNQFINFECLAR